MSAGLKTMVASPVWTRFRHIPYYLAKPVRLVQSYDRSNLRPDIIAGITVAVILLPQAIAFALIAELPPQMGLYAAVVGAVIGALWGSCEQLHTGPANAISLMVLSVLLEVAAPGTQEFFIAASFIAVMVGLLQLFMGLARLGLLVNFVSHSVIIGFAGGAGVLIAINQVKHLLRLELSSDNIMQTLQELAVNLPHLHPATATLGIGTMLLIAILKWINPRLPATLVSMIAASGAVYLLHLNEPGPDGAPGVAVIGQLPASLPPLAPLMQTLNLDFIADLSVGALAVGAIGLVQTTAIAQSIAAQTGQRLSSNQEFVGQGLANIAAGVFSGYPVAASFSRSAVSIGAGAKTGLSAIFSSMFVLLALFTLAPLAVYLPRAALAGVLIMTAFRMVDRTEIVRIWRGAPNDAVIMIVTFLATLFLTIEFAVLAGILLSFVVYVMKTSVPKVVAVLPDSQYRHLVPRPDKPPCPQLGIIDVFGDLYFGATSHFERAINRHIATFPPEAVSYRAGRTTSPGPLPAKRHRRPKLRADRPRHP